MIFNDPKFQDACHEAVEWVGARTPKEAWDECPRGDWLLWAAEAMKVDRRLLTEAACACAELVLHLVPKGDERPRKAIETARAWCRGEATLTQVREAANAASYYSTASAYSARSASAAACEDIQQATADAVRSVIKMRFPAEDVAL